MNVDKAYNVRSTICYPGVDTDFFRCQSVEKDIDVLFIGSQSEVDGYSLFLKLKKSFPKRKIISIDRYRRQISDAMLRAYYNRTKIVLCLSAQEPFGLIPLEANACCVPVVARNEGGYRETVIHGKTGLLVNATANDIFRACTILLDDEHKRKMMGLYAREIMLKRWQWQRHGERLEKILYNTIYKRCNEKVATPSVYIS
jgi:glycosyltransferase involved in cell wall biosynthesis